MKLFEKNPIKKFRYFYIETIILIYPCQIELHRMLYIVSSKICPKTLFSRILNIGVSQLLCILKANVYKSPKIFLTCGIEESLANILTDKTIQSRESVSHKLLRLLTRY